MWKERYCLGIEHIDRQHKTLFEKSGELIQEIEGQQRLEVYKEIIEFLQEYVITHFHDEEVYFASLGYADQEEHKRQHRELTKQVEKYSEELEKSHFSSDIIKRLAGMLSAWLIYHVVNEDLKYTLKAAEEKDFQEETSYMECFANSTIQVLEAMVGLDSKNVDKVKVHNNLNEEDVFVEIGLVGDLKGRVVFGFTKEFSSRLIETMMSFTPEAIDELVCSALAEVSNIASGNGTIAISEGGTACDICPPKILKNGLEGLPPHEEIAIETPIGTMMIAVYLD